MNLCVWTGHIYMGTKCCQYRRQGGEIRRTAGKLLSAHIKLSIITLS